MAFPRKDPSTNHRPDDRSGTSTADSRDSARQSGAPDHRGPRKVDGTLGSHATEHRGPTHPDRRTGGGALQGSVTPREAQGTRSDEGEERAPGSNAVSQPTRDDVHEQRSDAQPREGTVQPRLPGRAKP